MIVDCAVYERGKRLGERPDDLSDALDLARSLTDGFIWIGLFQPDAKELALVAEEFRLHPLAVEDAAKARQRPKLEVYGETLFAALRTIWYADETSDVETGQLLLFLGPAFCVSVRHGSGSPLTAVRHRLEERPELLRCGPAAVLYAVLDHVVDDYVAVAGALEDDVEIAEERVFRPGRHNEAEHIYKLKREVLEFRRAVLPLVTPLERLWRDGLPHVHVDTAPYFRDVHDHAVRAAESVEALDALLTGVFEANLAQVQVQQNEDMRRISAWVAMAAVPTMVAGIYGMNFEHMPELNLRYGYPAVLAAIAITLVALHHAFKRSGWL